MRTIIVHEGKEQYRLSQKEGESIMSALIAHDEKIRAFCGGTGRCGKCKIRVIDGFLPVTAEDQRYFNSRQLEEGYRLACMAYGETDCSIELCMEKEQKMEVVAEAQNMPADAAGTKKKTAESGERYAICADIGTTTIAMQLIDKDLEEVRAFYTGLNPQRSYGADVISRIHAANGGKEQILKKKIADALECGFRELIMEANVDADRVEEMILSANTTMVHLLMGYPCHTLGVSPFTPYCTAPAPVPIKEIIPNSLFDCPVKIIPGISAFVGGDIVSGLYYCGILNQEKPVLFIDFGTNGEMALGNKERLMVTSVAAGPAFEGGNISCGVGSIPGALCSVTMEQGKIAGINTIAGEEPVGICGTGVIETVSELVKEGLVDETGLLCEDLFETGLVLFQSGKNPVILTQKDIREIQLAKSAIRSGIEVLLKRYGIGYEEVECVYLAGGFGYHMNPDKMIHIGMLPKEFRGKVKAIGNSSLGGAKKVLFHEESWEELKKTAGLGEEVSLSPDPDFQQLYMEYLYF